MEEDEPDEEGFRPSAAFCRQLDAEEEYGLADEVAVGLRGAEALPPRATEVLDDNPYEQRLRERRWPAAPPEQQQEQQKEQQQQQKEQGQQKEQQQHGGGAASGAAPATAGSAGASGSGATAPRVADLDDADLDLLESLAFESSGGKPAPARAPHKFHKKPPRVKAKQAGGVGSEPAARPLDGSAVPMGKRGGIVHVAGY